MDWNYFIALITLIIAFCTLLDWFISRSEEEKAKSRLTEWFIRLDDYSFRSAIKEFQKLFNKLFNTIYGVRIRSWRFFTASVASSYFAIGVVATVFLALNKFGGEGIANDMFMAMIGISLFVNVWIDIISLIETRWILRWAEGKSIYALIGLLFLDFIFSALVYLIPIYSILLFGIMMEGEAFIEAFNEITRDFFSWSGTTETHLQVMFVSTFFTSFLFYLFMLTSLSAWALGLAKSRLLAVIEKLEDSNHLFKSLGGFLSAILGVIKGIYELF